jgi:hypothetical protein
MKENIAFALVLAVATAMVACAQQSSAEKPADRSQVLVLGVYHMANRGHDIYNMHADDVLTPKRQAEIAQVIEALRKFGSEQESVKVRDLRGFLESEVFSLGHWSTTAFAISTATTAAGSLSAMRMNPAKIVGLVRFLHRTESSIPQKSPSKPIF